MPAGYKIYQTNNFIKKIEKGPLDLERFKEMIQELAAASSLHSNHNLLIDIKEIEPLQSYYEVLKIVSEALKYRHAFQCKIAIVIANEPARIKRVKFFKAGFLRFYKYSLQTIQQASASHQ